MSQEPCGHNFLDSVSPATSGKSPCHCRGPGSRPRLSWAASAPAGPAAPPLSSEFSPTVPEVGGRALDDGCRTPAQLALASARCPGFPSPAHARGPPEQPRSQSYPPRAFPARASPAPALWVSRLGTREEGGSAGATSSDPETPYKEQEGSPAGTALIWAAPYLEWPDMARQLPALGGGGKEEGRGGGKVGNSEALRESGRRQLLL